MAEGQEGTPVPITKETVQRRTYPNLRFEPGTHGANAGILAGEMQAVAQDNRFHRGDPYDHHGIRD
jgi:hypothetical protein